MISLCNTYKNKSLTVRFFCNMWICRDKRCIRAVAIADFLVDYFHLPNGSVLCYYYGNVLGIVYFNLFLKDPNPFEPAHPKSYPSSKAVITKNPIPECLKIVCYNISVNFTRY